MLPMKFNVNANNRISESENINFFILVLDLICKLNMVSREIKKPHKCRAKSGEGSSSL